MPRIPDAELEQIKRGTDLAALVRAKGIELRPHGTGHLAGKCPFHDDATPSFIVTPEKNLFHCLGCGAGGTVIDFVMRHDGLSFRHAVEVLRSGQASALVATTAPTKHSTVRKLPPPVAYDADDQTLLAQVVDYYQERLMQTPAGPRLPGETRDQGPRRRSRPSGSASPTGRWGCGSRTSSAWPGRKSASGWSGLGVYRESGHEHLNGCLVIPILARWRDPGGLWQEDRRKPDARALPKHLYLPGPHRGLWNPACLASRR